MNDLEMIEESKKSVKTGAEIYELIRQSDLTIEMGFFAISMAIYEIGKAVGKDPRIKFMMTMDKAFAIKDNYLK